MLQFFSFIDSENCEKNSRISVFSYIEIVEKTFFFIYGNCRINNFSYMEIEG